MIAARPSREPWIRMAAVLLIITASAVAVLAVENMLLAFVLAFVINYLLAPLVNAVERAGVSRTTSTAAVYLLVGMAVVLTCWLALPGINTQISALKNEVPQFQAGITRLLSNWENRLAGYLSGMHEIHLSRKVDSILSDFFATSIKNLPAILSTSITMVILAPLFAFFMLIDGQMAMKKLLALVPNRLFETALNLQYQINRQIGGFVRARLLEAGIVGIVVWGGLVFLQFPYTMFLAVFAALTNLIPYLGPVIGAVPAVLLAVIHSGSGFDILMVAGVYAIAQFIDAVFIVPLVVARIVDLHAVVVIVVIIIGAQLGGILGMIISIPVASVIKLTATAIYQHALDWKP